LSQASAVAAELFVNDAGEAGIVLAGAKTQLRGTNEHRTSKIDGRHIKRPDQVVDLVQRWCES
jgi:hypothetical protein